MLRMAFLFLLIAIVAAILGFGTIAGVAATIAKVIFGIFLFLFLLLLVLAVVGVAELSGFLGRWRR